MNNKKLFFFLGVILMAACQSESDLRRFEFNFPEDCCQQAFEISHMIDVLSCESTAQLPVVHPDSVPMFEVRKTYVPCVFSPDSDQIINRTHSIFTNGFCNDICDVKVYAQNGEMVYSNGAYSVDEFSMGWDGMINNQMVEGPFEVVYQLKCADDNDFEVRGIVCSLLCNINSEESYFEAGLDSEVMRWPSQNEEGSFNLFNPDECFQ